MDASAAAAARSSTACALAFGRKRLRSPGVPRAGLPWRAVVRRLLLASPRGYCAGVERAVETVERALELNGPPVYVRKQIVHNAHVVRDLERRGAVFVESEEDVPEGAVLVLSAHGVAPAVRTRAERRGLRTVDATCPLVAKVHAEARRYAADGYTIVLVGHAGPRGGRGHARRGAGRDRPRPDASRTPSSVDGRGPGPRRLRHADDAVGRRDGGDRRGAPPPLPGDRRAPGR